MGTLTESQAIEIAKQKLSTMDKSFTYSNMIMEEVEEFVYGYLYDMSYQSLEPIPYLDKNGYQFAILIHEE